MKVAPLLVIALAAATGCGADPFTVVVRGEQVSLLAYRDGDGAWQGLAVGDQLRARIEITEGRYSLAWVCGAVSTTTHVIHSTLPDEPYVSCDGTGGGGGFGTSELFGMTRPNAEVSVGMQTTVADAAGFYGLIVSTGYHDVIALTDEDPPRIYIEHDVDLWSSRELALPVADRGVALEERTPVVHGTQQQITTGSRLRTRNGDAVVFPPRGATLLVPPASALAAGDAALVYVVGENGCTAQAPAGDATPRVDLPDPPVPSLVHGQLGWSSDVDWDVVRVVADDRDSFTGGTSYIAEATRDWMDEADTDVVELPDATQLPGWKPAWTTLRANDDVSYDVHVERGRDDGAYAGCAVLDARASW
jgi:hypothetical protein